MLLLLYRSDYASGQATVSDKIYDKTGRELKDVIIKTCEASNERCSKVINARSKVSDTWILHYYSSSLIDVMSPCHKGRQSLNIERSIALSRYRNY